MQTQQILEMSLGLVREPVGKPVLSHVLRILETVFAMSGMMPMIGETE